MSHLNVNQPVSPFYKPCGLYVVAVSHHSPNEPNVCEATGFNLRVSLEYCIQALSKGLVLSQRRRNMKSSQKCHFKSSWWPIYSLLWRRIKLDNPSQCPGWHVSGQSKTNTFAEPCALRDPTRFESKLSSWQQWWNDTGGRCKWISRSYVGVHSQISVTLPCLM